MSNLEHITHKILADAEAQKEAILAAAKAEAETLIKQAEAEAKVSLATASTRAEEQAAMTRDRVLYSTERAARDLVLAARRKALERIFSLAEVKLVELDDETYMSVLKQALAQVESVEQAGTSAEPLELCLPPDRVVKVAAAGLDRVELKADTEMKAGFKISRAGVTVNNDFVDLLHYLKDDLLKGAAAALDSKVKAVRDET